MFHRDKAHGFQVFVPLALMAANPGHCETNPQEGMSIVSIMFFEFFLTSLLIFLVCSLLDVRNSAKQDSAPVKFGLCVAGLIFSGVIQTSRYSVFAPKTCHYSKS